VTFSCQKLSGITDFCFYCCFTDHTLRCNNTDQQNYLSTITYTWQLINRPKKIYMYSNEVELEENKLDWEMASTL